MTPKSKKVFVGKRIIEPALSFLRNSGHEIVIWDGSSDPTEDEWVEQAKGMHGLLLLGHQKITKKIIEAAGDQLEVVSTMSVGVDSIDINHLKKCSIKLGHTPNVLTDAVAEIAVSLLLAVARRIVVEVDIARNGQWKTWNPFLNLGKGLRNSTVGIVGLGRIGAATAKRLLPFRISKLIYSSRCEKTEAAKDLGAEYVTFEELLSRSDFVIICCSMNPSTKGLFDRSAFSKMKRNAILVNIGRGGMIDQDALVEALSNQTIKGAGLDVTTPEPLPVDHPLFTFKNCVISPHIGSSEEQTRIDMIELAAQNLVCALNGEQMPAEYPL